MWGRSKVVARLGNFMGSRMRGKSGNGHRNPDGRQGGSDGSWRHREGELRSLRERQKPQHLLT